MLSDFTSFLSHELRSSKHTSEAYLRDIRQFVDFHTIGNPDDFDPEAVTIGDIRHWIGSLADNGLTATSLRRKIQSLRAFYKWGLKTGRLNMNPASDMILPKKRKKLPDFINDKEIESLFDKDRPIATGKSPSVTFLSSRADIAVEILYSLGLRQAELLSLDDSDVNLISKEIKVTGKRNKQRVVPLPSKLADKIERWQKIRDDMYPSLKEPKPLLAGPHGRLSKQTLYKIVNQRLSATSSVKKSPHTLRHTFATVMLNNGANLDTVREMLGHASLSTTQIYTHLSFKELLDNYQQGHPRVKGSSNKKC